MDGESWEVRDGGLVVDAVRLSLAVVFAGSFADDESSPSVGGGGVGGAVGGVCGPGGLGGG